MFVFSFLNCFTEVSAHSFHLFKAVIPCLGEFTALCSHHSLN